MPAVHPRRRRIDRKASAATVLALALTITAIAVGAGSSDLQTLLRALLHGHAEELRTQLAQLGTWAPVMLFALILAHTVLPFPAELLAAAGGFALGFSIALPLLVIGFLVSAALAYMIGAHVGRPVVAALVGRGRLARVEQIAAGAGPRGLLAVRLIPLVPFSPLCFACGLASVPMRRFLWTTAVGMLPELAIVTFLGTRLRTAGVSDPTVWIPTSAILVLLLFGPMIWRAWAARRRPALAG